MSFGEEAEEDETEVNDFVQKNANKSKSVHDVINDPKLSKEPVHIEKRDADDLIEDRQAESDDDVKIKGKTDRVRDKLKKFSTSDHSEKRKAQPEPNQPQSESDSDEFTNELERERKLKRQKKAYDIHFFYEFNLNYSTKSFFFQICFPVMKFGMKLKL